MPLTPRDGGTRRRIEITADIDPENAGDWYEVKTELGFHERMNASNTRGFSFKIPAGRLQSGRDLDPGQLVTVSSDGAADAAVIKLAIYLTDWSHGDKITALTIRRIPPLSADYLLNAITEIEAAQEGPSKDSPLQPGSNGSSKPPSANVPVEAVVPAE